MTQKDNNIKENKSNNSVVVPPAVPAKHSAAQSPTQNETQVEKTPTTTTKYQVAP